MTTQPLDAGQARQALESIVADYGPTALSNAQFMNNVLRDLLPDQPREASVLVAAAEADVAGILRERTAQHISPGAAVAQAAATLGERTALTQDACLWAARQMAQALDLMPGQQTESRAVEPPGGATIPPGGYGVGPANPPAGYGVGPANPPAGYGAGPNNPPAGYGAGPNNPPAGYGAGPANPPAGYGPGPGGRPTGYGPGPAAPTPPMPPAMPGMYQPMQAPPGSPGSTGPAAAKRRQNIWIASGVAAVVVLYLVIAAAAHLAPFGKAKDPGHHTALSSPPASSASPSPSATPSSPSPSATVTPTAADNELLSLIPTSVKNDGNCLPQKSPSFNSISTVYCHDESPIPAKVVDYYLFDKTVTMNIAYRTFLGSFAHTTESDISCSPGIDFTKFIPKCETIYDTNKIRQGRVVEYIYKTRPDMSWTVNKHKLLIDASGNTGTRGYALLRWWTNSATHWVQGGL